MIIWMTKGTLTSGVVLSASISLLKETSPLDPRLINLPMLSGWVARRCYGTGTGACSVSRADVFDAPLALLCQLVAVGVDVVVVGINGALMMMLSLAVEDR